MCDNEPMPLFRSMINAYNAWGREPASTVIPGFSEPSMPQYYPLSPLKYFAKTY